MDEGISKNLRTARWYKFATKWMSKVNFFHLVLTLFLSSRVRFFTTHLINPHLLYLETLLQMPDRWTLGIKSFHFNPYPSITLSIMNTKIKQYHRSEDITNTFQLKFENAPFPSITLCNLNPYKKSMIYSNPATKSTVSCSSLNYVSLDDEENEKKFDKFVDGSVRQSCCQRRSNWRRRQYSQFIESITTR